MAKVLALVDDLFFRARIADTARLVGVEFESAPTPEALVTAAGASEHRPSLLLIDLNAGASRVFRGGTSLGTVPSVAAESQGLRALELLREAGNQTPVVAFLSHVQVDLAERARLAGAREVLPRSKFTQDLAAILGRAKSEASV